MSLASKQAVRWRTLEDRPFTEARRTDKLVFLYVGCTWNWGARLVDKNILIEPELAERLNREFVPVRIDATVRPEWEPGPFPLMAAATNADPGWYVLVTRPDGTPLSWLARQDGQLRVDLQMLQNLITSAERQSEALDAGGSNTLAQQAQNESAFLLGRDPDESGDLTVYGQRVAEEATPPTPFETRGIASLRPWEWRFLLAAGMVPEATFGLEAVLQSQLVDWLYGGLYHELIRGNTYGPKFDKLAIENADMACVLAHWWAKTHQPLAKRMAQSIFDSTFDEFVSSEDVASYSWLDPKDLGREPQTSLRPRLMRKVFSAEEQQWMTRKLGLDPKTNPSMVVRVTDVGDYSSRRERYERVFAQIREALGKRVANTGGRDLADTLASTAARLCETARVLGDEPRQRRALALAARIWSYRVGPDGVAQALKPSPDAIAYLGDYLSVCDAALQMYLLEGEAKTLESGAMILKRALDIFQSGKALRSIPVERELKEAPWVGLPNVVDGSKGSLVGQFVRIGNAYSLLLRDQTLGKDLRTAVVSIVSQYASLTRRMPARIGCLASAMLWATEDRALFVTGPDSKSVADRLATVGGEALVAPLRPGLRKDIQSRGEGIWLCQGDVVSGPLSETSARTALRGSP